MENLESPSSIKALQWCNPILDFNLFPEVANWLTPVLLLGLQLSINTYSLSHTQWQLKTPLAGENIYANSGFCGLNNSILFNEIPKSHSNIVNKRERMWYDGSASHWVSYSFLWKETDTAATAKCVVCSDQTPNSFGQQRKQALWSKPLPSMITLQVPRGWILMTPFLSYIFYQPLKASLLCFKVE